MHLSYQVFLWYASLDEVMEKHIKLSLQFQHKQIHVKVESCAFLHATNKTNVIMKLKCMLTIAMSLKCQCLMTGMCIWKLRCNIVDRYSIKLIMLSSLRC